MKETSKKQMMLLNGLLKEGTVIFTLKFLDETPDRKIEGTLNEETLKELGRWTPLSHLESTVVFPVFNLENCDWGAFRIEDVNWEETEIEL